MPSVHPRVPTTSLSPRALLSSATHSLTGENRTRRFAILAKYCALPPQESVGSTWLSCRQRSLLSLGILPLLHCVILKPPSLALTLPQAGSFALASRPPLSPPLFTCLSGSSHPPMLWHAANFDLVLSGVSRQRHGTGIRRLHARQRGAHKVDHRRHRRNRAPERRFLQVDGTERTDSTEMTTGQHGCSPRE